MDSAARTVADSVGNALPTESGSTPAILSAMELYKRFGLEERKTVMDQQSLEIADRQEESANNRKRLAEITKNYKKAEAADKALLFPNLLKSYQDEIDSLTKRSKSAESLFLGIYKDIRYLSDPVPFFLVGLESTKKLGLLVEKDEEIKKLKAQNEEYFEELQSVKNQEVTVRRLEEQIRDLQAKMTDMVKQGVSSKEKALKDEFGEAQTRLKEREKELLHKIQSKDEQARQESMNASQAQLKLIELQQKMETILEEKQELYELTLAELQKAQERIVALERVQEVNKGISSSPAPFKTERIPKPSLEREVDAKNILIDELRGQIAMLERQLYIVEQKATEQSQLLQKKDAEMKVLHSEVAERPTSSAFMDLKKRFYLLQGLEYGTGSSDVLLQLQEDGLDSSLTEFESVLLDNHKKTCSELTKTRLRVTELEKASSDSQEIHERLKSELSNLKELNKKLEQDLETGYSNARAEPRKPDTQPPAILSDGELTQQINTSANSEEAEGAKNQKHSLLQIVSSQRDRFRERVDELENANRSLKDQTDRLKQELSTLQSDNVKLYEKIRYLQNYSQNRDKDIEAASSSVESKYSKLYEESINPFAQFHKKEAMKKYKELNTADRVILIISNIIHGSKHARTFVFFYTILLHFLVFLMLYQLANYQCQIYEVADPSGVKVDKGGIGPNHL